MPGVAKLNSASAAGKCQALPRPVSVQCPHRLQISEKPKAEALGSDLFSWLCSPSLLITPSVDIVVGVVESQPRPEVLAINKMPFMKWFLPRTFNEKCFALFYLCWMPRWDWWEVCSSRAGVSSRSQRLSEVAFLKLVCLWLTNLCLAFRWEREIEEGWVNRQTGASFILGSANCFTYIRGFVGGLLDKQFLPAPSLWAENGEGFHFLTRTKARCQEGEMTLHTCVLGGPEKQHSHEKCTGLHHLLCLPRKPSPKICCISHQPSHMPEIWRRKLCMTESKEGGSNTKLGKTSCVPCPFMLDTYFTHGKQKAPRKWFQNMHKVKRELLFSCWLQESQEYSYTPICNV